MERVLLFGLGGDGYTQTPFPQYVFTPQGLAGWRDAVLAASQTMGPFTVGKYHQIVVTTACWIRVGMDPAGPFPIGNAVVGTPAGGGDFPLAPGVYLWLPTATTRWISYIRDTADGVISIGQCEV